MTPDGMYAERIAMNMQKGKKSYLGIMVSANRFMCCIWVSTKCSSSCDVE
jgi:hypothetical protein